MPYFARVRGYLLVEFAIDDVNRATKIAAIIEREAHDRALRRRRFGGVLTWRSDAEKYADRRFHLAGTFVDDAEFLRRARDAADGLDAHRRVEKSRALRERFHFIYVLGDIDLEYVMAGILAFDDGRGIHSGE